MGRTHRCGVALAALILALLATSTAQAEHDDDAHGSEPSAERKAAALASTMLPFTMTPQGGLTYGVFTSGYDNARGVALYNAHADAKVIGGLSVRAGYASPDLSGRASALFGPRFQLLNQEHHGLDLGVAVFYMPQNIYDEGLVMGRVSLARSLGPVQLVGNVGYGQDPEGDDHRAEAAAATMLRVSNALFIGLDSRLRALVATSDAKHAKLGEPVLDLAVGPMATYRLGVFALVAQAGASALWLDHKGLPMARTDSAVGAFGMLGAGLAL